MALQMDTFTTLLAALQKAGVATGSARGFWGGITSDNDVVVTAWFDAMDAQGRFVVARPQRRHGGLRDAWDQRRVVPGATVKLILVRQRGDVRLGDPGRIVKDAALMPGRWRVVELTQDENDWPHAVIEPLNAH